MFRAKLKPNTPNGSGEEVDIVVFGIFSNGVILDICLDPVLQF